MTNHVCKQQLPNRSQELWTTLPTKYCYICVLNNVTWCKDKQWSLMFNFDFSFLVTDQSKEKSTLVRQEKAQKKAHAGQRHKTLSSVLGVRACTCNPSTWEVKPAGFGIKGHPGLMWSRRLTWATWDSVFNMGDEDFLKNTPWISTSRYTLCRGIAIPFALSLSLLHPLPPSPSSSLILPLYLISPWVEVLTTEHTFFKTEQLWVFSVSKVRKLEHIHTEVSWKACWDKIPTPLLSSWFRRTE